MTSRVLRIDMSDFGPSYRRLGAEFGAAGRRGALKGAMRAVGTLQRATSKAPPANPSGKGKGGAVNTGAYKRGWKWAKEPDGASVYNAMAYASIIENGRRKNSRRPPLDVIARWAQRKLGLSVREARRAAFPIARAIAKRGLIARQVMGSSVLKIEEDFLIEVIKELDKALLKLGPSP
jgi:hypothetical protein